MAVQTQIQTRRGTAASWTSTNPTLAAGEIGFESDTNKFKIGTGSTAWNSLAYAGGATAVTYLFNATAGQTTFSGADANSLTLAYTVGAEQVYLNGVLLVRGTDYTATNGTSVVLASGAVVSDVLNVIAYSTMSITDTYTQAQADAKFVQTAVDRAAGKNIVINGGMDVWQRGTSIAIPGTSTITYTADRWMNARGVTGQTVSRQATGDTTNLPNIQYCARVARDSGNTGTTAIRFFTSFETVNSIPLAGKTVTISWYARAGANFSAASNTMVCEVTSGTGTDQNILAGYTGASTFIVTPNTLTTTWQRFTATGTVATTATELSVGFYFTPVGTAGAADYFEITGVQLEQGSVATAFTRNASTYQGELAACQRYYVRYTCESGANYAVFAPSGLAETSTYAICYTPLPVQLRAYPTSVEYGGSLLIFGTSGTAAVSSISIQDRTNTKTVAITYNATGLTATTFAGVRANNSSTAYLGINAEL